jgi:crotonobetainyl-CoA:carnitine CoA-transferase CaiB-like acyl-CoA transferase
VSDAEWKGLCEVLGCEDWIADPRFSTAAARMANVSVRKELTATQIAGWDTQDLLERLEAADVPAAPLLTRLDLIEDAQIKANGTLVVTDYDGLGRVRQPRPAARFSETPGAIAQSAPLLGQHNREVLESLGYAPDAIERLEDQGILRAS